MTTLPGWLAVRLLYASSHAGSSGSSCGTTWLPSIAFSPTSSIISIVASSITAFTLSTFVIRFAKRFIANAFFVTDVRSSLPFVKIAALSLCARMLPVMSAFAVCPRWIALPRYAPWPGDLLSHENRIVLFAILPTAFASPELTRTA
jgi:hypothetical protein